MSIVHSDISFSNDSRDAGVYCWRPLETLYLLSELDVLDVPCRHKIPSTISVVRKMTATQTAVPITSTARTGRKPGLGNYSDEEIKHLFDIMESILPIGPDEWNQVVELHAQKYPRRDVDSIRRKYSTLHRKSIPTGDPLCPPLVKQAKQIKHLIGSRASIGDAEEEFDLVNGYTKAPPVAAPHVLAHAPAYLAHYQPAAATVAPTAAATVAPTAAAAVAPTVAAAVLKKYFFKFGSM